MSLHVVNETHHKYFAVMPATLCKHCRCAAHRFSAAPTILAPQGNIGTDSASYSLGNTMEYDTSDLIQRLDRLASNDDQNACFMTSRGPGSFCGVLFVFFETIKCSRQVSGDFDIVCFPTRLSPYIMVVRADDKLGVYISHWSYIISPKSQSHFILCLL